MRRLIVNADDFGIHAAVNAGIATGHRDGIITSASLMAGGGAFDDAVRLAAENPRLGVGVHLTLVGGGKPVLPAAAVPTLVDGQGCFPAGHPAFIASYLAGRIALDEAAAELAAQVAKIVTAGVTPSHFDSHQHLHALPGIFAIVTDLAGRYGVRALRKPAESLTYFGGMKASAGRVIGRSGLSLLAGWTMRSEKMAGLKAPQYFFGMLAGGQMNLARLKRVLDSLPDGDAEVMTHPGMNGASLAAVFSWQYQWESELQALTSPEIRQLIKQRSIKLISFREL